MHVALLASVHRMCQGLSSTCCPLLLLLKQTVLAVDAFNATGASTALTNETRATIFAPTDA